MRRARWRTGAAFAAAAAVAVLSGCSTTVSLTAAPDADDPDCAKITAYLPGTLDGQPRRWTDAQATGAWGSDETSIIVSCGVDAPAASELPCQTVDGVDWIVDDSEAPNYRFTTFGRTPAVQVYIDYDEVSGFAVIDKLSDLVTKLPKTGECTARPTPGASETPGATPAP